MNFSQKQISLIESPFDRSVFLQGPAGAGKSSAGIGRLNYLMDSGISGRKILLFFPQRNLGQGYQDSLSQFNGRGLSLPVSATYGGFARRYLNLFWPAIEKEFPEFQSSLSPTFLTLESSLYFLSKVAEPLIENQGFFSSVTIQRNRLYSQILDNLNKSAIHSFPHQEIADRLASAWTGDPSHITVYHQAQEAANLFRNYCYDHNLLDYSLQIELFTKSIKRIPLVADHILNQFDHLIYDNCEEDVPVSHDFIRSLFPQLSSALIIYDTDAGYRSFLGASPSSGYSLSANCDENVHFSEIITSSSQLQDFNQELSGAIYKEKQSKKPTKDILEDAFSIIYRPSYPEMVSWVAETTQGLIESGVEPNQIVIIAPFLSDSLRFLLRNALESHRISVSTHRPSRALRDEPITHALLTWAAMAHPDWEIHPSPFELSLALVQSIKDLDLTRSHLIARQSLKNKPSSNVRLADFEDFSQEFRDRITYFTGGMYQELVDWLKAYAGQPALPLDHFFTHLFSELLSRPGFGFQNDLSKGRITSQIIESAGNFRQITSKILRFDDTRSGKEYFRMVKTGVLANQYIRSWTELPDDSVFIAPAYTFLLNNNAVEYQFWLDIGARGWYERIYQPLTNPHLLHRDWPLGQTWSDEQEQEQNTDALVCLTTGLIRRCRQHIYGCLTETDERGFEQKGKLLEAFNRMLFDYNQSNPEGEIF